MKRSVQDVRQRRDLMIQALNQSPSKSLTVETLAQLAKVSTMTVRRDLNLLAKMGIIERHHGYAILNEVPFSRAIPKIPISNKSNRPSLKKPLLI